MYYTPKVKSDGHKNVEHQNILSQTEQLICRFTDQHREEAPTAWFASHGRCFLTPPLPNVPSTTSQCRSGHHQVKQHFAFIHLGHRKVLGHSDNVCSRRKSLQTFKYPFNSLLWKDLGPRTLLWRWAPEVISRKLQQSRTDTTSAVGQKHRHCFVECKVPTPRYRDLLITRFRMAAARMLSQRHVLSQSQKEVVQYSTQSCRKGLSVCGTPRPPQSPHSAHELGTPGAHTKAMKFTPAKHKNLTSSSLKSQNQCLNCHYLLKSCIENLHPGIL